MKSSAAAIGLAALLAGAVPAAAAPAAPARKQSWDFVVTLTDLARGQLEVEWTLRGFAGPTTVRADMPGAERGVRQLRALGPGGEQPLRPDPDYPKEWIALAKEGEPLRLAYRYDLAAMADESGDPDYAAAVGGQFLFCDEAVLLRPDPLPDDAEITVEFRLPPGITVATPWERLPGAGYRYRTDAHQYDCGSYLAVGKLTDLGEVPVRGGALRVMMIDRPHKAAVEVIRHWVERSATLVANFYGGIPGRRPLLLLAPVASTEAGVYGTTLRRGLPSVAMYFGADAPPEAFDHAPMLLHELFHTGNPPTKGKPRWAIEGFTTYYEEVLRARAGEETALATWSELYDGFRRHCAPERGRSLAEESRRIGEWRHYARVYWGGACVAFQVDVAIREHSGGKQSLDDVMRALRTVDEPLSEAEWIARLDRAAGVKMVRALLDTTKPVPLDKLYKELGIEPPGKDDGKNLVRLRDDAPGAALRRGIF